MKKILFILTLGFLVGCSNDDDNNAGNSQNNFIKIDNVEYELEAGLIEDYGLYQAGLYNFDVVLISSDVTNVGGELVPNDQFISGIVFELYTASENDLSIGTYNLVDSDNISDQTFEYAEVVENLDVTSENDEGAFSVLVSGTLEVLSNAPVYEFEFSGTDSNGKSISGYYKGDLFTEEFED